jgi:hypothetical protein
MVKPPIDIDAIGKAAAYKAWANLLRQYEAAANREELRPVITRLRRKLGITPTVEEKRTANAERVRLHRVRKANALQAEWEFEAEKQRPEHRRQRIAQCIAAIVKLEAQIQRLHKKGDHAGANMVARRLPYLRRDLQEAEKPR